MVSREALVSDCVRSFISEFGDSWFLAETAEPFAELAPVDGVMKGLTELPFFGVTLEPCL